MGFVFSIELVKSFFKYFLYKIGFWVKHTSKSSSKNLAELYFHFQNSTVHKSIFLIHLRWGAEDGLTNNCKIAI